MKDKDKRIRPDDRDILALTEAGRSSRQVAAILGNISYQTVCRRLKYLTPRKSTEIFKAYRADIFAEKARKLLMRGNKLTTKEERDIAVAIGVYFDKERLARNQSTANIDSHVNARNMSPELLEQLRRGIAAMYENPKTEILNPDPGEKTE